MSWKQNEGIFSGSFLGELTMNTKTRHTRKTVQVISALLTVKINQKKKCIFCSTDLDEPANIGDVGRGLANRFILFCLQRDLNSF